MRILLSKLLSDDKWYQLFLCGMVLAGGVSFLLLFYLIWSGAFQSLLPAEIAIPGRDFKIFYNAATRFSQGAGIAEAGYIYFPLVVYYHQLFSHLGFYPAFLAISLWNLLLAVIAAFLAIKILGHYQVRLSATGKWLVLFSIIFFCPVTASLNSGNVNTLVFSFITMFFFFLCVKDKNVYAGLSLAVAAVFKIFPAALLLLAAFQRRFKFVLVFLLILALIGVLSILLLGIPAHLYFMEYVAFYQDGKAVGSNAAISGIIYNSLGLLNIKGTAQSVINISWLLIRLAFVFTILGYLYPRFKARGEVFRNKEWTILLFSLFSVLMVSLTNHSWVYYASCLVLPFLLFVFCLKLTLSEKILLALSIAFFSFNTHIESLFAVIGGVFSSLVYVVHPGVIGNLLFLALVLLKIVRLRQAEYKLSPKG